MYQQNPSVSDGCKGLTIGKSYCVEAAFEPEPEPEPSSKPEPKPKTTKKPEPSPTKAANGTTYVLTQTAHRFY